MRLSGSRQKKSPAEAALVRKGDNHLLESCRILERRARPRGPETTRPGTLAPRDVERVEQNLARERAIIAAHLLGEEDEALGDGGQRLQQRREIARRA